MSFSRSFVPPAKAGPGAANAPVWPPWVPAFAGMTKKKRRYYLSESYHQIQGSTLSSAVAVWPLGTSVTRIFQIPDWSLKASGNSFIASP